MKHRLFIALLGLVTLASPRVSSVAHAQEGATDGYKKTWKGVASLQTRKLHQKTRDLLAVYPVLHSSRPVARAASAALKKQVLGQYTAFEKKSRGTAQQLDLMPGLSYEFQVVPYLELNRPRLISTSLLTYDFEGGAHGIGYTTGYVFGFPSGSATPRQLKLADFFTTNLATTRKRINSLLMAKLRATIGTEQEAIWVKEGTVKSLTPSQMENFIVEANNLKWVFPPYAVGPFANGEYTVKLSPRELGPTFRAALLR